MTHIYYIEDDPDIAAAVAEYLEQKGFRVTLCATLARARAALESHLPTLVLLDWNMPDGHGDRLCRWIRSRWKDLPIIFLTVRSDASDIVSGFRDGADDYVVKPFRNRELVSRIRSVLRRSGKGTSVLRCGDIALNTETGKVTRGGSEIALTKLEYKILSNMMSCPGKLFTRDEILSDIWDISGNFVNDNTLSVTVKRLREKLGDSDGRLIKTVRGMGYRLER